MTRDTLPASLDAGREWELLGAFGEMRAPGGLVYQFEYRIKARKNDTIVQGDGYQ